MNGVAVYHTYPHVDFADTGARAARLLVGLITDGLKPVIARQFPFAEPNSEMAHTMTSGEGTCWSGGASTPWKT